MGVPGTDPLAQLSLPPGFRFYPTDEELLVQYLCRKVAGYEFSLEIIGEIDLYKFDPWVLPSKAMFGEKEWYFFSPRDRKYPNGSRPNRVAGTGYWKATGTDKVISTEGRQVGIKKALVFYIGKAPKGNKTNWIMHEYRLLASTRKSGSTKLDEWVLCRIYKKSSGGQKPSTSTSSSKEQSHGSHSPSSSLDNMLETLPEINDQRFALPHANSLRIAQHQQQQQQQQRHEQKPSLQALMGSGSFDWATLAGLNLEPQQQLVPVSQPQPQGLVNYGGNDVFVPQMNRLDGLQRQQLGGSANEEVQSGIRTQPPAPAAGLYQPSSTGFAQNLANSLDPYGFRYSAHNVGLGFRQ